MRQKIDAVLDRIKEPETGLSIAKLGFVERLRYNKDKKTLIIFTGALKPNHHYCCSVLQGLLISGTQKSLTEEFQKEFPDLSIEWA